MQGNFKKLTEKIDQKFTSIKEMKELNPKLAEIIEDSLQSESKTEFDSYMRKLDHV